MRWRVWGTLGCATAAYLLGFSLTVHSQSAQAPQQLQQAQPQPQSPEQQQTQGRGGRGGRGLGGPGVNDPANAEADFTPQPPVLPLPPADQAKHFILQPGYRITPVLTDPDIQEPGAIAFDGNGRMFVLELRGYMQTADARGQLDPVGRISRHEDADNDGVYERHTVFVDKLVFPRFVLPFGANSVLTMESNADDVWQFTDTNNDGVADKKELFTSNFGRSGNVEHQQAFLYWGMDNWLYSTVNAFRVRWTPTGVKREPTGSNGAQWGATQDNDGKMWFQGGASGLPSLFQFPVHYGNFQVANQFEKDFEIPWGAPVRVADMQPGMGAVRMPDGSLNRVTGSAGNDIYRGDRLPADLVGDLIYGEPVGRIVRRVKPVVTEGLTQLKNAYVWNEFIKSTDPLFRPVDMATAPDGTLYISDMYRGIIQEATWSGPGTYLRARIDQYALDKVTSKGRIWRVTYEGKDRDRTQPRMLNETPAQLVAHLSHPNGWWRDTAQQLLVLKQDKSVVPALQQIVRTSKNRYARFHALWTLEGLGALDPALVRQQMKDPDPRMRIQAIRVSESLYKDGNRSFADDYRALTTDKDTDVVLQAMLTLNYFKVANAADVIRAAMAGNPARGVQEIGTQMLKPAASAFGRGGRGGPPPFTPDEVTVMERGATIYKEVCFACHGDDGRGTPAPDGGAGATMAPSLASSTRVQGHRDYVIKTLLHGLDGPIEGRTYAGGVMAPMGSNRDEWIAAVGSYVRNTFGNAAGFVTPADVARVRAATAERKTFWKIDELLASLPVALDPQPTWKATASHNPEAAAGAFSFASWTTGAPQAPGMWFQIELPETKTITELQFTSPGGGGFGGGGRGRGGRAGGTPGAPGTAPAPVPVTQPAPAGAFGMHPRGLKLEVSTDGRTWTTATEGAGTPGPNTLSFAPIQAKFLKITQTATLENAPAWSMQRLRLFSPGASGGAR
ncbi:MAG TPA: c-type cytochrome [Vicinamibacterales bacterium]|nr:c-type cytochrome [Vicinamibacterales bacterium]